MDREDRRARARAGGRGRSSRPSCSAGSRVMPGSTNMTPANAAMPPAVLRTSEPIARPRRPVTVRKSAQPTTARATCGAPIVVCTWCCRRIACETKNAISAEGSIEREARPRRRRRRLRPEHGQPVRNGAERRSDHAGRVLAADHEHAEHTDRELRDVPAADAGVHRDRRWPGRARSSATSAPSARRRRRSRDRPSRRRRAAATSGSSAGSRASSTPSGRRAAA